MLIRISQTAVDPSLFDVRRLQDEADDLGERIGFVRCLDDYRYSASAGATPMVGRYLDPAEAINLVVRTTMERIKT